MIRYNPGDVVLVRFPFTDLAAVKKRPALVLSPPEFSDRYDDIVVLAMTSQPQPDDQLRVHEWRQAGLPKPTWFKPLIATVACGIIDRRIGTLQHQDQPRAVDVIRLLISSRFAS